uniref:PH domain-containing protein n=1 Tax=Sinocyclocheilus rhinocerous TaxID=307959 RepID=A0A673IC51_9TELE
MVMGEASRGSPSLQEGVLKAGWLKKQRSIMKNWQLRWFVLRADHLYFYKDEEETKPQVCSALKTYRNIPMKRNVAFKRCTSAGIREAVSVR